jgi:sirohydrochlorin ferrochelatase
MKSIEEMAMTRNKLLITLGVSFLLLLGCLKPTKGEESVGVLLIAHGSPKEVWNNSVQEVVKMVNLPYPIELGFLEYVPNRTIGRAVDELRAKGAVNIVAVPLFISSYSNHIEEIKYILRLRKEPPSGAEDLHPLESKVSFILTPALDDHPLVAEILADRVRKQSISPRDEIAVLAAHGAETEEDLIKWDEQLASLSAHLKQTLGLKEARYGYIFEEKPLYLRRVMEEAAREGTVIVVPVMVSSGFFTEKYIPKILTNLTYKYNSNCLSPDRRLASWVEMMVKYALRRKVDP